VNTEDRNLALRAAILEWQKKYGIRDGDPMLATLELFHIYFEGLQVRDAATAHRPLLFEEFRGSLELVDERAKSFVKQSAELIGEMRTFSALQEQLRSFRASGIILLALAAAGAGVLLGKFIL